jgi:hypothetical protein
MSARVSEFLNKIPEKTDVVLTGRYAPKELIEKVDFVNEVVDVKYPSEMVTTKGIQYWPCGGSFLSEERPSASPLILFAMLLKTGRYLRIRYVFPSVLLSLINEAPMKGQADLLMASVQTGGCTAMHNHSASVDSTTWKLP